MMPRSGVAPNSLFAIIRPNHIGFTVASINESLKFWVGALGFEVDEPISIDPEYASQFTGVPGAVFTVVYVHAPGIDIELLEYAGPLDRKQLIARPCDVGYAHVCFEVDDIHAAIAASVQVGWHAIAAILQIPAGPMQGLSFATVRGPDGVTVEFWQR